MIVVSDSSPINFLIRLECVFVLEKLFRQVWIPMAVANELSRDSTPSEVASFVRNPPSWLVLREPSAIEPIPRLDPGEQAAISLAIEIGADVILIDDRAGRIAATNRGFLTIGLIGILERADAQRLLSLPDVFDRLPADYRIDIRILEAALRHHTQRRRDPT